MKLGRGNFGFKGNYSPRNWLYKRAMPIRRRGLGGKRDLFRDRIKVAEEVAS